MNRIVPFTFFWHGYQTALKNYGFKEVRVWAPFWSFEDHLIELNFKNDPNKRPHESLDIEFKRGIFNGTKLSFKNLEEFENYLLSFKVMYA